MDRTYNPALHRFAVFTAASTVLLLTAGALVTSNDAGLSVPDWPLSYGSLLPPMIGGIFYEHGHRLIASSVGLLTIVLAVWLWRREARRWVRCLGMVALGSVVLQGILGGLTVKFFLPPPVSVAHATLAQIFFCMVLGLALVTSRWWQSELPLMEDRGSPPVRWIAAATAGAVMLQLVLGAAFRHNAFGIVPHLIGAGVVTAMVITTAAALRKRFPGDALFTRCRRLLHGLLGAQILLGGAAWWSLLATRDAPQPMLAMVWLTVAHTVTGALVLGGATLVTLVCFRTVRPREEMAAGPMQTQVIVRTQ